MAHIVMGPVTVEDPSFLLQPLLKRSPWKGGENRKGGKFDIVLLDEFDRFFKDVWIISIEPKDKGAVDADSMALNGLNQIDNSFACTNRFETPSSSPGEGIQNR